VGVLPRWSLVPLKSNLSPGRLTMNVLPNNGVSPDGVPSEGLPKAMPASQAPGQQTDPEPDGAFENVPTFPVPEHMGIPRRIHRLGRAPSFPINVRPTEPDVAISRGIARHTAPVPEEIARMLTWAADEKLLLVLASIGWLASRDAASRCGALAIMLYSLRSAPRCCLTG